MTFPIISIIKNEYNVFDNIENYLVCPKKYIPLLNETEEIIIDSQAIMYQRGEVKFKRYTNIFYGFSLRFAQFGISIVDKKIERIRKIENSDIDLIFKNCSELQDSQKRTNKSQSAEENIKNIIKAL